jgi:hypothetical protein
MSNIGVASDQYRTSASIYARSIYYCGSFDALRKDLAECGVAPQRRKLVTQLPPDGQPAAVVFCFRLKAAEERNVILYHSNSRY